MAAEVASFAWRMKPLPPTGAGTCICLQALAEEKLAFPARIPAVLRLISIPDVAINPPQYPHAPRRFFRAWPRSADLLSGLVNLIGAGSMLPPQVECAAATLRAILIGRTAPIAAKTLSAVAVTATSASAELGKVEEERPTWCLAAAAGEAVLAWKEGRGLMKVPLSKGSEPRGKQKVLCAVPRARSRVMVGFPPPRL